MQARISIITLGVQDLSRACEFYQQGLGLPTSKKAEDGIAFFRTKGTCLALYPLDKLAEDIGEGYKRQKRKEIERTRN